LCWEKMVRIRLKFHSFTSLTGEGGWGDRKGMEGEWGLVTEGDWDRGRAKQRNLRRGKKTGRTSQPGSGS